jgi:hypothetical protein
MTSLAASSASNSLVESFGLLTIGVPDKRDAPPWLGVSH